MKIILSGLLAVSALGMLSACNTANVQSWTDPQFKGRPIGKTMILGVVEDADVCREYESLFAGRLLELGVTAASLHADHITSSGKVSKDALTTLLKQEGFDSIIITRLVSQQQGKQFYSTNRYPSYYGNYYGYYDNSFGLSSSKTETRTFMEFDLETNLYEVDSEQLIWTGKKTVYDDSSDLENIKAVIKGVVNDLHKQGMIE